MGDEVIEEQAAESKPAEQSSKKTLADLAIAYGQVQNAPVKGDHHFVTADGKPIAFKPQHLAASVYHGWALYEHQTGRKVLLSDSDYLAAIEASKKDAAHAPANLRARE